MTLKAPRPLPSAGELLQPRSATGAIARGLIAVGLTLTLVGLTAVIPPTAGMIAIAVILAIAAVIALVAICRSDRLAATNLVAYLVLAASSGTAAIIVHHLGG